MKRVVAPRDEARDDFDVFADLSEMWEAGGRERFTEGKTDLQWLETFYQIASQRGLRRACPCRHLLSSGRRINSSKCQKASRTRGLCALLTSVAIRRITR